MKLEELENKFALIAGTVIDGTEGSQERYGYCTRW
jgi:hypothetical protein